MRSRTILITIGAVIAAFAVAFGIGKATSGSEASTAAAGPAAQTIDVPTAEISAGAPQAGLPALKPKPTPKPTQTPAPTSPTAPEPTTEAPTTQTPAPTAQPQPQPEQPVTGVQGPGSGG